MENKLNEFLVEQHELQFEDFLKDLNNVNNKDRIKTIFEETFDLLKSDQENKYSFENFQSIIFPLIRRIIDNSENKIIQEFNTQKFCEKCLKDYVFYINLHNEEYKTVIDLDANFCAMFSYMYLNN